MARHRRELFVAAQVILGVAVLFFAGRELARQWQELPPQTFELDLGLGAIAASGLIVLVSYTILIQTWRLVLGSWGRTLPMASAARVWFVSNLGRYVPGKVWQIGALGVMAQRRGISPVAATGAAILVNLLSVLVGFALVLAFGARTIQQPALAFAAVVLGLAGLALAPMMLPRLARLLESVTGRSVPVPALPGRAIWISALGTGVAWLLYGTAFQLLALGTLGEAAGIWTEYVAVFVGSYLVGYLVLLSPGGLVVRELAMAAALTSLGLATADEALVLAFVSRVWLTVLELGPGVYFLLRRERGQRIPDPPGDVPSG